MAYKSRPSALPTASMKHQDYGNFIVAGTATIGTSDFPEADESEGQAALTPAARLRLVDDDLVPEVAVMASTELGIGERGQTGYVLRQVFRHAFLIDKPRPRRVSGSVRIAGARKVGPGCDQLVGEDRPNSFPL